VKAFVYDNRGASLLVARNHKAAIFSSVKCPGKLILAAYDLAQSLSKAGVTVVGGFHSPMEQEFLRILLRSSNPVIWCLARGKLTRVPPDLQKPVTEGRMQIVAPFPDKVRRQTTATSAKRNRIVADMAANVIVIHAAPGSKIEALSLELLAAGKPLYTFDHPSNAAMLQAGARAITPNLNWQHLLMCAATKEPDSDRKGHPR
jgi:predicted Rossmann fold nucleotide-binding protein DprA/Smf involved in DNA uptake